MSEEIESDDDPVAMIFTTVPLEDSSCLSKLRSELRTDYLNAEERVSLIQIFEECSDVFHSLEFQELGVYST
jgi:hypothetical protein